MIVTPSTSRPSIVVSVGSRPITGREGIVIEEIRRRNGDNPDYCGSPPKA